MTQPESFLTWRTMKHEYLSDIENKNTRSAYDYALRAYKKGLKKVDADLDPITGSFKALREGIKLWIWEASTKVTGSTMQCHLKGVRLFYRWLIDEGYLEKNPAENIKVKRKATGNVEFPDTELADRFLKFMERETQSEKVSDIRDYILVRVLRESGLRVS